MITVVGLGVNEGDLTKKGKEAILSAKKVFVRTKNTRSYKNLTEISVEHIALDYIYEKSRSFKTLNTALAIEVKKGGDGVVYCVDGAAGEDNSVKELIRIMRGRVNIINGVSKIDAILSIAGFSSCSYTAVSAYDAEEKYTKDGLSAPLIIYDLDDKGLAGDIKLLLSDAFGENTTIKYIIDGKSKNIPVYELDRQKQYNYTSAISLNEIPLLKKERFTLVDLKNIILRLRQPDGCPWDRVQTPDSIKMNAVEEAYELVDAIDSGDDSKVLEETGDVFMQAVFHAVMKEEAGSFNMVDSISGVCEKLISRHTHIFGEDKAVDAGDALLVWEKNKMTEKGQDTFSDSVNDVPKVFPALMQAQKVAKRIEKGGWDICTIEDAEAKLKEEYGELKNAYKKGDEDLIKEELGDFLMSVATLSRAVGVDGEEALLEAVKKVKRRYTAYEKAVIADGKDVLKLTKEEKDKYYKYVKEQEKGQK